MEKLFLLVILGVSTCWGLETNLDLTDHRVNLDDFLDYCIDSKNHKERPGPEDDLHKQCMPWKERSCCTLNTTFHAHESKLYNFNWDHCSHKKKMSDKCRKHFVQDLCFYECSPNVGPWTVKVNQSFRKERFYQVPLCASECEAWFTDCADDLTCTDNWPRNMEFVKGLGNKCPANSKCDTYKNIYRSSADFCEKVWDYSWEVVDDSKPCMKMWFDPQNGNPNDKVAKWKAEKLIKAMKTYSSSAPTTSSGIMMTISILVVAMFKQY